MFAEENLAITTKLMEQDAIMMGQLRQRHTEQTKHMEVEVRRMEEVVATQVVLQAMKLEIMQRVGTANLFLMLGQDMARHPAQLAVDTHNQTPTSPTVNQVKIQQLDVLTICHPCWHFFVV
jgi:hypothetical protein